MNEETLYRVMAWAAVAMAAISAISTVILLILTVTRGFWLLIPTILLFAVTCACCAATVYFGQRVSGHKKVFSNEIEQEVLSRRQRRELRNKRGGLVMQRALIEIENEQDNIVHRQIESANDPKKPPHRTRCGIED
jgi:hypothetical protein